MDNVKKKLIEARVEANLLLNGVLQTLPIQGDDKRGAEYKKLKALQNAVEAIDNALLALAGF